MSYANQADLSTDADFRQRIAACAATQDVTGQPTAWADAHQWQIAAAPTFADKYSSAVVGGVDRPGRDESVISDADLLAAVQATMPPAPVQGDAKRKD